MPGGVEAGEAAPDIAAEIVRRLEQAGERGVAIGFWRHFRIGAPVTVLTILVGVYWL
jgi:hypothetical protein